MLTKQTKAKQINESLILSKNETSYNELEPIHLS